MAMTETDEEMDRLLEEVFAASRQDAPVPPAALVGRILADAAAVQAAQAAPAALRPRARPGLLASALAALGGWGGLGGLAAATLAGVWIGFTDAGGLGAAAAGLWGGAEDLAVSDFLPGEAEFSALGLGLEG